MAELLTCGAIQSGMLVVLCQCGLVRQASRPHAFRAELQIKGWFCDCGIFNGEEKEYQKSCRTCNRARV